MILRGWLVALAAVLLVGWGSAASAAELPDGTYQYRVLLSDVVVSVVCENGACQVQPFALESTAATGPQLDLTDPVELVDGAATLDLPPAPDAACNQARSLTLTVTATDLTGRISADEVSTANCFSSAFTTGFAAEVISAPVAASEESDAPSVLSKLRTVGDVTPAEVGTAAGGAVVLVALVAFPATLLNAAVEGASQRLAARRQKRHEGGLAKDVAESSSPWWAAGGVLAAGVISTFVDPGAGANAGTVRLFGSLLSSFALEVVVGWFVVLLLMRRMNPSAVASYSFRPASLLVVAGLVLFSRLTDFEPGIIFGLVAGVTFLAAGGRRERAMETLVPAMYALGVAVLAWFVFSALGEQSGGVALFVSETLSAAVVGGIAALPLVLLPVRGLPGAPVFAWDRRVWVACYAFALIAFFVVLMPFPASSSQIDGSLVGWLIGYAVYFVVGLVAWLMLRDKSDGADVVA